MTILFVDLYLFHNSSSDFGDRLLGDLGVSALTNEIVQNHSARVCGHQKLSEIFQEKIKQFSF